MSHFDAYGKMARLKVAETCQNGRYAIQSEAESLVPKDLIEKLRPTDNNSFLDIGCGMGLMLTPMAQLVHSVTGCDHPSVIEKAKEKISTNNISLVGGNFLELDIQDSFDRILAYSVLPALPDRATLFQFVDKALSLLRTSGRMVLGDLSNRDKKIRFTNSKRGKAFLTRWNELYQNQSADENLSTFDDAGTAVTIDDELVFGIIKHIRHQGFHAYLLDQPQNLPFGNSREDILVVGPEYEEIPHD